MDVNTVAKGRYSLNYCKIIYLDQWVWIKLAQVHYGKKKDGLWTEVYLRVLNAAACHQAIFPLDFCRFTETQQIPDSGKRLRLANFMFLISGGYTMLALPLLQKIEIMSYLTQHKIKIKEIRNHGLIGESIEHMMGSKGEISAPAGEFPKDFLKHLSATISHPKTIWCLLLHGGKELREKYISMLEPLTKMLEETRLRAKKDLEYEDIINVNWYEVGMDYLKKMFSIANRLVQKPQIPPLNNRKDVIGFFSSIPTLNVSIKLSTTRDVLNRPVDRNDTLDLGYLYLAIPYCDFVFTEKFWAKQANDCILGEKYKTIISHEPDKLIELLPDSGLKLRTS